MILFLLACSTGQTGTDPIVGAPERALTGTFTDTGPYPGCGPWPDYDMAYVCDEIRVCCFGDPNSADDPYECTFFVDDVPTVECTGIMGCAHAAREVQCAACDMPDGVCG